MGLMAGDGEALLAKVEAVLSPVVDAPGLDRELRKDREFVWAVGKDVRCWVREPVAGRLEFAGRLEAASTERLVIQAPDGGRDEVPRSLLTKARLDPPFRRK